MSGRAAQRNPTRFPRQLWLFAGVVLLPLAVLVAFGAKFVRQETELGVRRLELSRESAVRDLSAALFERLERHAEAAIRTLDPDEVVRYPGDATLTFLGSRDGTGFVAAWEGSTPVAPVESRRFSTLRSSGERMEVSGRLGEAAALYRRALDVAGAPYETGLAGLRLARVEMRTGSREAASSALEPVVEIPTDVMDARGIPVRAYALEMLLTLNPSSPAAITGLESLLADSTWKLPEVAIYKRDLVTLADSAGTNPVIQESIARLLAEVGQPRRSGPCHPSSTPILAKATNPFGSSCRIRRGSCGGPQPALHPLQSSRFRWTASQHSCLKDPKPP